MGAEIIKNGTGELLFYDTHYGSGLISMDLSQIELVRYDRQLRLSGIGRSGQEKLKRSRIFIAGAGGLGSAAALYLAAAGIGYLTICDYDTVSMSNLNRQVLYREEDLGKPKTELIADMLARFNPHLQVTSLQERITEDNAARLIGDAHIICDCLDNARSRFIINSVSVSNRIPYVYGSCRGTRGKSLSSYRTKPPA